MARRRRKQQQPYGVYYMRPSGPPPHPVLSAILGAMVTLAICYVLVNTLGPVIDYFNVFVSTPPAGADYATYALYANPVLPMFPWAYFFITALAIVSVAGVWIAVVRSLTYGRYGD